MFASGFPPNMSLTVFVATLFASSSEYHSSSCSIFDRICPATRNIPTLNSCRDAGQIASFGVHAVTALIILFASDANEFTCPKRYGLSDCAPMNDRTFCGVFDINHTSPRNLRFPSIASRASRYASLFAGSVDHFFHALDIASGSDSDSHVNFLISTQFFTSASFIIDIPATVFVAFSTGAPDDMATHLSKNDSAFESPIISNDPVNPSDSNCLWISFDAASLPNATRAAFATFMDPSHASDLPVRSAIPLGRVDVNAWIRGLMRPKRIALDVKLATFSTTLVLLPSHRISATVFFSSLFPYIDSTCFFTFLSLLCNKVSNALIVS